MIERDYTKLSFQALLRVLYESELKIWRAEVLKRDNYKCINCGATERLHADHI